MREMYREEFREVQSNVYWSAPRVFLALLMALIAMYAIGFVATGGGLAIYRFWAPKQENARREVFVNTDSFIEGKIGSLTQERVAYESASGEQKQSLRTMILSDAAQVDNSKLPSDLREFISGLKGGF